MNNNKIDSIIEYIDHTPENVNNAILKQMLYEITCTHDSDDPLFHFKNEDMIDLFQWSTGIILVFDTKYVGEEVHFSNNKVNSYTRTINKFGEVTIPDFLLQKASPLEVYLVLKNEDGSYTKKRRIIKVLARPKPENYVSGEEEVKIWDTKLDSNLGAENAGKILVIDENGNISTTNFSSVGDDKSYIYTQSSAAEIWQINHNLNKFPSVTIVDSSNSVVIGDIIYNDLNNLTVNFSAAFSGKAYLN